MFGWFKKEAPKAPEPIAGDDPPGEADKVMKIKNLCWMASMSGESIKGLSPDELKEEFNAYENNRYQIMLLEATNLARELTDTFYRDSALHFLIGAVMSAGDEVQAKKLFQIIEVDIIQDAVLKQYPRLAANF